METKYCIDCIRYAVGPYNEPCKTCIDRTLARKDMNDYKPFFEMKKDDKDG